MQIVSTADNQGLEVHNSNNISVVRAEEQSVNSRHATVHYLSYSFTQL